MRRARLTLICALFCGSLLAIPGAAIAGGCNNSAANTQYVDPLTCQNNPSHKGTKTTPAPQPTAPAATSTPSSTPTATTASGKSDPSSSKKTLPFTGLNLWPAVLIGIGLLALGLVLRRRALDVRRWH